MGHVGVLVITCLDGDGSALIKLSRRVILVVGHLQSVGAIRVDSAMLRVEDLSLGTDEEEPCGKTRRTFAMRCYGSSDVTLLQRVRCFGSSGSLGCLSAPIGFHSGSCWCCGAMWGDHFADVGFAERAGS